MLEHYFKRGAIFEWTRPSPVGGPLDGVIMDKTVRTPRMTFLGTAADLGFPAQMDPALTPAHMLHHGLRPGTQIRYRWLDYMPGRTARVRIGRRNILTGPMSGCPIVRYTDPAGQHHVAHVGTIDGNATVNTLVKATFRAAAPANTTGFNPAGAWDPGDLTPDMTTSARFSGPQILAYVNGRGHFYATAFLRVNPNDFGNWFCAGSKRVAPLQGAALTALLT